MQNDKTCSEIVSALARTRTEANLLLEELDLLSRALYKTGTEDFESVLSRDIRAKTANAISMAVVGSDKEAFIKSLKAKIESLSYLGLTIAFEPSLEIIGRLNLWIQQNLGQGVALDITINKSILGGAIIEYKGKIKSFTILSDVDNYFLNNHVNL